MVKRLRNDFEVKKVYKGGVLIPKEYRDMLDLKDGESVIVMKKDNCIVIERLDAYFEQKEK